MASIILWHADIFQEMWNGGSQLVALNFQTPSEEMNLYLGKFRDNGGVRSLLLFSLPFMMGF